MRLSEWWRAQRELNRLYQLRPYSYLLYACCLLVAVLGILGSNLIWQGTNAPRWYWGMTASVPMGLYHWGLLLWLVRRDRARRRNDPS